MKSLIPAGAVVLMLMMGLPEAWPNSSRMR